jgi:hypothetical protein
MPAKNIIDSRLFIRLDLSPSFLSNQLFGNNLINKGHLASQLILYDSVIIPTYDFGIVPILISWFGFEDFKRIIKTGAVKFLRRDGMIAYVGGGNGISVISIWEGPSKHLEWWQEAIFDEDEKSLELQITKNFPNTSTKQNRQLVHEILKNVKHLSYDNDFFVKNIARESYEDILKSRTLLDLVEKYGKRGRDGSINLEMLEEVTPRQTRVLGQTGIYGDAFHDVVDLVLRVAEINMELLMATQSDNADLFTLQGTEKILKQKLAHAKVPQRLLNGFTRILDLSNIPDIRPAVVKGELQISEIWKIRQSSKGKKFREWLREVEPKSARDLERVYVEAVGKNTLADALPMTSIRFAITSLVGMIDPVVGLGAGVIDSFFVDNWLKGFSPKLFFDVLQKLMISKRTK